MTEMLQMLLGAAGLFLRRCSASFEVMCRMNWSSGADTAAAAAADAATAAAAAAADADSDADAKADACASW